MCVCVVVVVVGGGGGGGGALGLEGGLPSGRSGGAGVSPKGSLGTFSEGFEEFASGSHHDLNTPCNLGRPRGRRIEDASGDEPHLFFS